MIMPHPDEIALLLALPEGVRERLARMPGPGWSIYEGWRSQASAYSPPLEYTMAKPDRGWLPASEAAILSVTGQACCLYVNPTGDYVAARTGVFEEPCEGVTARIAALKLLRRLTA